MRTPVPGLGIVPIVSRDKKKNRECDTVSASSRRVVRWVLGQLSPQRVYSTVKTTYARRLPAASKHNRAGWHGGCSEHLVGADESLQIAVATMSNESEVNFPGLDGPGLVRSS